MISRGITRNSTGKKSRCFKSIFRYRFIFLNLFIYDLIPDSYVLGPDQHCMGRDWDDVLSNWESTLQARLNTLSIKL